MSTISADAVFDFLRYSARLREVTRHNNATAERRESVAEHSWHLALIAWVLHDGFQREFDTELDLTKMLKMCLMHDLVEIDAGDPSAWTLTTEEANHAKEKAEWAVARERFGALPPPLDAEFLAVWAEHEAGETLEAKLVRGIDRLNPALMRYLTGQGWDEVGATASDLDALVLSRITVSDTLTDIYQRIRDDAIRTGLLPSGQ